MFPIIIALSLITTSSAFVLSNPAVLLSRHQIIKQNAAFNMEASISKTKEMRLKHLEDQAMFALKVAVENSEHPVFPNAMIAGDCVITHLLGRLGYLDSNKVKIMVVDTLHLFPETMQFLKTIEDHYNFKAEVFLPQGCENKKDYDVKYGSNLWVEDIEQYDKVCKVEPFQRGLKKLQTDMMINGRTRWQGAERAWIDMFENAPIGGGLAKVNPLAYWTLEDTFDYLTKYNAPLHPLHAQGYPSIGDAKDTVKVPADGSVKFINGLWSGNKAEWLGYGLERKGRFVGLQNKDGSSKTECGIHVAGAEKTFDRDLWPESRDVVALHKERLVQLVEEGSSSHSTLLVIYAPWCKYCQAMEESFSQVASELSHDNAAVQVGKYRGDEDREFVSKMFGVKSFPTIVKISRTGEVVKYSSEERDPVSLKQFVGAK